MPKLPLLIKRHALDGVCLALMLLGLSAFARGVVDPSPLTLVDGRMPIWDTTMVAGVAAMLSMLALAIRLAAAMPRRVRSIWRLAPSQTGTQTVEFALVCPAFFFMLVLIYNLAVYANGALVVRYAAFTCARVAAAQTERGTAGLGAEKVSDQGKADARQAALMILSIISPVSPSTPDTRLTSIQKFIRTAEANSGPWSNAGQPMRLNWAQAATKFDGLDNMMTTPTNGIVVPHPLAPGMVRVQLTYEMKLPVPGLAIFPAFQTSSMMYQGFRYDTFRIVQTAIVQSTGPRQANSGLVAAVMMSWLNRESNQYSNAIPFFAGVPYP
jgi:Flp pilus assembly protein TadG